MIKHNGGERTYIKWATNDYQHLGTGYTFQDQITPDKITGEHSLLIRPRSQKSREEQRRRAVGKAEVFTPSWVCNKQNNLVDDAWFGRSGVFNTEIDTDEGRHTWRTNTDKIFFPQGQTWQDYVRLRRMELTCGEAPYLVSRYDVTEAHTRLIPVVCRIGLLDRKLRVVNENAQSIDEWKAEAFNALHSTYGFEYQGDNLLLAREALLLTFAEHYVARFGDQPTQKMLEKAAYIISWNIWQMDGSKCVVPATCQATELLFAGKKEECPGCAGKSERHNGVKCYVVEWRHTRAEKPNRVGCKKAIYEFGQLLIKKK